MPQHGTSLSPAQDEPLDYSIKQLIHTPRGAITVASAIVSLAAMLPFVYIEVRQQAVHAPHELQQRSL
jgi:cytochrome c-type biogenesis protein CcmH/NrfG